MTATARSGLERTAQHQLPPGTLPRLMAHLGCRLPLRPSRPSRPNRTHPVAGHVTTSIEHVQHPLRTTHPLTSASEDDDDCTGTALTGDRSTAASLGGASLDMACGWSCDSSSSSRMWLSSFEDRRRLIAAALASTPTCGSDTQAPCAAWVASGAEAERLHASASVNDMMRHAPPARLPPDSGPSGATNSGPGAGWRKEAALATRQRMCHWVNAARLRTWRWATGCGAIAAG